MNELEFYLEALVTIPVLGWLICPDFVTWMDFAKEKQKQKTEELRLSNTSVSCPLLLFLSWWRFIWNNMIVNYFILIMARHGVRTGVVKFDSISHQPCDNDRITSLRPFLNFYNVGSAYSLFPLPSLRWRLLLQTVLLRWTLAVGDDLVHRGSTSFWGLSLIKGRVPVILESFSWSWLNNK